MHIIVQAKCDRCYDQVIKCYDECFCVWCFFFKGQLLPTRALEVLAGLAFDLSTDF